MENEIDVMGLVIDLILTFVIYEIMPILLKFTQDKQYTEKEAKKVAIINSVVVYIGLFILYVVLDREQIPNMVVSFFWGTVSYNILKPSKKNEKQEKMKCKVCNKEILYNENGTCEECHQEILRRLEIDAKATPKKNEEVQKDVTYFSKKFVVIMLVIIVFLTCIVDFFIYLYFKDGYEELQTENKNLITQNNNHLNRINQLENENKEYKEKSTEDSNKITSMENKAIFMDRHVVIVPNNTNIFHKYDCQYLDISDGGLVYNPENAKAEGFVPCSKCIK